MKILGIDTSSAAASVAVSEEGMILAESFVNVKLTHSQTMMPMLEAMLQNACLSFEDIDALAVTCGPGSFTGLRIGISAVKGIAFPSDKPCFGVSTLQALACNLMGFEGFVVPAMDARCGQVYTSVFLAEQGEITRMEEDCALSLEELGEKLSRLEDGKPVFFVGDGAKLCYNKFQKAGRFFLAPPHLRYARASSVCLAAAKQQPVSARVLAPSYLRLSQAERERLQRQKAEGER